MNTYLVDLHVHTAASPDGRSPLADLAAAAKQAGLDAMAICDHDLCTPVPEALEGVLLIPACEVSTRAGHITGLFLDRPLDLEALGRLPAPEAGVAAIRVAGGLAVLAHPLHRPLGLDPRGRLPAPGAAPAAIREAGGLAVLAHPFHRPGRREEDFPFDVDGVEAANARAAFKVPDANDRAAAFAAARSLSPVGGSDAHDAREVGNAYTELTAETLTVPALRAALAAGRSQAVLARNTAHVRKGLSQWTKALRQGGLLRLGKAAAYVCWCAWLDVTDRR